MRVTAFILITVGAWSMPVATEAQSGGGSSVEYIRTPDGPREPKFFYEGPVIGEGNVMMLSGRGETSYLDVASDYTMKVVFSGTVVEVTDTTITLEAPERSQQFDVMSETSLCRDGVPGAGLSDFEPGSAATLQTSVEAPETAEKTISGLHVFNPMGSFADQPAIAECD